MYKNERYFLNLTFFLLYTHYNNTYIYSQRAGHVTRKPDLVACEQQKRRPGCAFMLSDPRRCYSLYTTYIISKSA